MVNFRDYEKLNKIATFVIGSLSLDYITRTNILTQSDYTAANPAAQAEIRAAMVRKFPEAFGPSLCPTLRTQADVANATTVLGYVP